MKTVKINFFQKLFDSKWRAFLFQWQQRNYLRYLRNRVQWYVYPNIRHVAQFPLHLDIETTAVCNLRCPMCPSRHLSKQDYARRRHMDMNVYQRLVDKCAEQGIFSIRLSWRGEALTNPEFDECVRYAKLEKRILQVSFLTNGFGLKGDVAEKLIDYGLDYVSVSVDGMDEMYERIRYPMKFSDIYTILADFKALREKKGKNKPQIRITTLWPAIASNPRRYYETMSRVSDMIVCNPLKDYSITTQDRQDFKICQFLFERLFVGFDGLVHPCSNTKSPIVVGDAKTESIYDIWHGEEMNKLRSMHKAGRRLEVPGCNECSYGVDYEKRWKDRDWTNWDPRELPPPIR